MKRKIISALLLSAMLLTACGESGEQVTETTVETSVTAAEETTAEDNASETTEQTTLSPFEEALQRIIENNDKEEAKAEAIDYSEIDSLGEGMLAMLSPYIVEDIEPELLTGERAEKLDEALQNIRINNSRIPLPIKVADLPEGFSAVYIHDSENESDYYCSGELFFGDKKCADIQLLRHKNSEEEDGIIISLIAFSTDCKWDFDGITYSNETEKIIDRYGEPSFYSTLSMGGESGMVYVTEKGSVAVLGGLGTFMWGITINLENLSDNAELAEYVPYDDFEDIPEYPELTGGPREVDWNMLFEDDCIVIGNDKYPVNAKISDLSSDIVLLEYYIGTTDTENADYVDDEYILTYRNRQIAMFAAKRHKDEQQGDARIFSWIFTDTDQYPMSGGVMGISFSRNHEDIQSIYIPDDPEQPVYSAEIEHNGEKYSCRMSFWGENIFISATPDVTDGIN